MSSSEALPPVERKGILVVHRSGLPVPIATKSEATNVKKQPAVYIFLSGFPDSSSTFDSFAKPFEETHHVVKICYPDMDETCLRSFWGYSLRQVEMALVAVIQEYRETHHCETIYLHGFDWGAAVTLLIAHDYPNIITKLIQQDIGVIKATQMSLYDMIVIPSYQIYLAWVFLLSRIIVGITGDDDLATRILGFLPRCFPWFLLMTETPKGIEYQMLPHRCYPYLGVIVDIMTGNGLDLKFTPSVPQFFAYGAKKNVCFHTNGYLKQLESTPKCFSKAYSGSHWFHTTHEAEFQADVLKFLKEQ
ncbi:1-acylglycerol-3-phosphate O-acyltransferase [Fragilaria crotonensis]|nr:1-acylglycerol-3-phosphate O-acyltransferase [Fragilaria crotonensis]